MKKAQPVSCAIAGCGKVWPRDPVLEVPCPEKVCQAAVGHKCTVLRPSGHRQTGSFAGLPDWGHDERDLLADREGHYGVCPLGRCGARNKGATTK